MTQHYETLQIPRKLFLAEIRVTLKNPEGMNIYSKGYMRFAVFTTVPIAVPFSLAVMHLSLKPNYQRLESETKVAFHLATGANCFENAFCGSFNAVVIFLILDEVSNGKLQ